jgi:hypothetical protein
VPPPQKPKNGFPLIADIIISKELMTKNEFDLCLAEIRKSAKKNGLTEKILQEILAEDD